MPEIIFCCKMKVRTRRENFREKVLCLYKIPRQEPRLFSWILREREQSSRPSETSGLNNNSWLFSQRMCFEVITGDDSLSETVSKLQNSFNVREIKEDKDIWNKKHFSPKFRSGHQTHQLSDISEKSFEFEICSPRHCSVCEWRRYFGC